MIAAMYNIPPNVLVNVGVIVFTFFIILVFARKGASSFAKVRRQIQKENDFYTELILGIESAGQNVCSPTLIGRDTRVAIWELFNNLRVQPNRQAKSIALQRKMLDKKQTLYENLEKGRVNLEILPFIGIIGTLLGFAIPYLMTLGDPTAIKSTFNVTGIGFILAASSTVFALVSLIYVKKRYEAVTLAEYDYYLQQQRSLEKIMISYDGFQFLEDWLSGWPLEDLNASTQRISMQRRLNRQQVVVPRKITKKAKKDDGEDSSNRLGAVAADASQKRHNLDDVVDAIQRSEE